MWERVASQENRRGGSIFERKRFKEFAHERDLDGFFGGSGYRFAGLHEPAHEVKRLRASSPSAGTAGTRKKYAHRTLAYVKRWRCRNDGMARQCVYRPTSVLRDLHGQSFGASG